MSNYTKATDFASKDALLTGDPLKIVNGTELNDEFNAIQTANNTKANTNSPTLTGAPSSPTASAGTNSTQLATTAFVTTALTNYSSVVETLLQALYPVGTIYTNATDGTNPATLVGFGTWSAFGTGRVMVGLDSGNTLMDAAEETGGSADAVVVSHTHTATVTDPGHSHVQTNDNLTGVDGDYYGAGARYVANGQDTSTETTGVTVANSTEGVSGTDLNYQPFITVYYWKRTA
tara:strand:+ start:5671 stop:6369 length:699 start_codon:yes stop_codon:yes gene_type:complete